MPINIIKEREYIKETEYTLSFYATDETSCSYSFDCDKDGNVNTADLTPLGLENYKKCVAGQMDGYSKEAKLEKRTHAYWQCAIGECPCGRHVYLENFTNTCECGIDYNSSGQRLAPRSQWGEETGEHWSECY